MTVKELCSYDCFKAVCLPEPNREVTGAYVGDLLSWVMGRASADCAWVTIMSNVNVVAVATLADTACVILAEGVTLEEEIRQTATDKGVNVLCSELPIYETALKLGELI